MSLACFFVFAILPAHAETFSERHGKKETDSSTFSGRHEGGDRSGGVSPDSKSTWHGAEFGSGPLSDMRCVAPEPALAKYKECARPDDAGDRDIGELEAKEVTYRYWNGELFEVQLLVPDAEAATIVLRALRMKYGKPTAAGAYPAWEGSVLHIVTRARGPGITLTYVDASTREDLDSAFVEAGVDPAVKAAADL